MNNQQKSKNIFQKQQFKVECPFKGENKVIFCVYSIYAFIIRAIKASIMVAVLAILFHL